MNVAFDIDSLKAIAPEILLFLTALLILLADILSGPAKKRSVVTATALMGLGLSLISAFITIKQPAAEVFARVLMIDPVSQFFKILLIMAGMVGVLLGRMSKEVGEGEKTEIHALLTLGTLGMCVMCSAVHFLLLFLAYETVGITCSILAAFKRKCSKSSEAGTKNFFSGALTSVFFAMGIVMLYGIGKSFNILDIRAQLSGGSMAVGYLWVAFGMIFIAIAVRMAIFPFHSLEPDSVQGSASPVSAFFSVSAKIAATAFALRLFMHLFSVRTDGQWVQLAGFAWPELIAGVAAMTMTIGNLTALYQTNLKRLIGYSCVAQMGFILMGLAVSNPFGIAAVLFSLAAYGIVTLGVFFVIQMVVDNAKSEDIKILRGLGWRNPYEAVVLCIFLLSLAGLPPMVGFVGRFYVIGVAVKQKLYWLSLVAAVNWVIGLTYYLFMIREIFSPRARHNRGGSDTMVSTPISQVALAMFLIPTVVLGIYWDPLMNYITRSLGNVLW